MAEHSVRPWAALLVVLACGQAALLFGIAWDKADTPDESRYIGGAIVQWARGDFTSYPHCPVPKWGFGAALRLVEPWIAETPAKSWEDAAHIHLFKRPLWRLRRNLIAARVATILVTVAGGVFVWLVARRGGPAMGAFAHALWCFSPTVLANGSLATLDAWVASLLALCLWLGVRLLESPRPARAWLAGAGFGLALGTKIVVVPWLGAALLAPWCAREAGHWTRALALSARLGLGCFVTLWAVHGFDTGYSVMGTLATRQVSGSLVGPLPFPTWVQGFDTQVQVGAMGRRNYLFGIMRKEGWWWFYLAVIALKLTVGGQALGLLRTLDMARRSRGRDLLVDAALLGPPLALTAVLSLSDNQAGARFLLPAFPFLMVWTARLLEGRAPTSRWWRRAAVGALLLGAGESLAAYPHELMFFNVWAGGPAGGPRYLIQSDDWGQDQRRLGNWQQERGVPGVFYTPFPDNPGPWGIRFRPAPCTPRIGVFALHAAEVHRPKRVPPGCYDWLTVEPPDERIGYSIYIYVVDKDRLRRLAAERDTPTPFYRGRPTEGGR